MFLVRYSYETSSPNIAVIQLITNFFWTWLLKVLFLKKILSLAQLFFSLKITVQFHLFFVLEKNLGNVTQNISTHK